MRCQETKTVASEQGEFLAFIVQLTRMKETLALLNITRELFSSSFRQFFVSRSSGYTT